MFQDSNRNLEMLADSRIQVGAISKKDLAGFLRYAKTEFDLPIIQSFLEATPTAELEPITDKYVQSDEQVRAPGVKSG